MVEMWGWRDVDVGMGMWMVGMGMGMGIGMWDGDVEWRYVPYTPCSSKEENDMYQLSKQIQPFHKRPKARKDCWRCEIKYWK